MLQDADSPRRFRRPRALLGLLAGLLILGLWLPLAADRAEEALRPRPPSTPPLSASPSLSTSAPGFLRGMTVTCPGIGEIWGSSHMVEASRQVRELGVEWVSIHPYAHIRTDGTIRHRPAALEGYLSRAVEIARQEGVELFWKPHLAYWGSFEWRGAITFGEDEAAWDRFFEGYLRFIVDQAAFAERSGVPLLAVGVELEGTTAREAEWRKILREVRKVYSGRITYAANWDRLASVPFWDAVDLVGVQAYFPLSSAAKPNREELHKGWEGHLEALGDLSRRLGGKQILFAEIGYNRSRNAAREPWDYSVENSPEARRLRERLLEVALSRLEEEPFIAGVFWWKWMPGRSAGRSNFSMRDPEALDALRRHWAPAPPPPASAGR